LKFTTKEIKTSKKTKESLQLVHIVGIGNITRLDDGIAIRIINELEKKNYPNYIKISDLGTGVFDLPLIFEGWSYGIIIDAVNIANLKPGEIIEMIIKKNNIPNFTGFSSTHNFDVLNALKLAYALQDFPLPKEILLIGVQVEKINGFGLILSKTIENTIPKLVKKIDKAIMKYVHSSETVNFSK